MPGFLCSMVGANFAPAAPSTITLDAVSFSPSDNYYYYDLSATATRQLTFSCWFKAKVTPPRSVPFGMRLTGRLVAGPFVFNSTNIATGRFYAQNISGTIDKSSTETALYAINQWTHFAYSLDLSGSGQIYMYINGIQLSVGAAIQSNDNFAWNDIDSVWVNGYDNTNMNDIEVCQIWMNNTYVDLSTNIDKFYNNGPVDLGSTGTATGLAQPLIYHDGDASSFPVNKGTLNYTLSVTGAPTSSVGPSTIAAIAIADWTTYDGSLDGANVTFTPTYTSFRYLGAMSLDANNAVWAQNNNAGRNQLSIRHLSISNTSVSVGDHQFFNTGQFGQNQEFVMCPVNSTTWLFPVFQTFFPVTVNGTTHTLGSGQALPAASYVFRTIYQNAVNQLIQCATTSVNSSLQIYSYASPTFTQQNNYALANHAYASIKPLSAIHSVLFYKGAGTTTLARLVTISGNSAAFGSEITLETALSPGYYYDYKHHKNHPHYYTNTVFAQLATSQQIKLYPLMLSAGVLSAGTTKTITGPDTVNYQNYNTHEIVPIDGTHWMLWAVYQNATTSAHKILANKILKVETNGTVSDGPWIPHYTTTTGGAIDRIYLGASRIDDNRVLKQWVDTSTVYLKIHKHT